jgi:hypothetical protein
MFLVGLDLGQAADYTALTVLERIEAAEGTAAQSGLSPGIRAHVRHLQRFALGTSYPDIVDRVKSLVERAPIKGNYQLVADATGCGRPVIDLLHQADVTTVPVLITGGTATNYDNGYWHVPKRELVSRLQVMLQSGRLKIADGLPEGPVLVKELLTFQVKITDSANDVYGAWREGQHDDLVLALALATWQIDRQLTQIFFAGF